MARTERVQEQDRGHAAGRGAEQVEVVEPADARGAVGEDRGQHQAPEEERERRNQVDDRERRESVGVDRQVEQHHQRPVDGDPEPGCEARQLEV